MDSLRTRLSTQKGLRTGLGLIGSGFVRPAEMCETHTIQIWSGYSSMCSVWIGVDTEVTIAQVIWRSKSQ